MSAVQLITIGEGDEGSRLDRWFKRQFPHIPHGRVEKFLRTGQVRVNGKRAKGNARLEAGQEVRVPPLPEPGEKKPERKLSEADINFMESLVIYQDNDLIALNKPSGLAVQGGTNTHRHIDGMLSAFNAERINARLVHRLDRDTSGVLVLAKNSKAATWLGKAFQNRKARKMYWGISNGVPRPMQGEVKGYMNKGEGMVGGVEGREIMVPVRHGDTGAKHARTLYQCPAVAGKRAAWIALQPLTGRKHQLRMHMELLGTPLVGDTKYTTARESPGGLSEILHLHAKTLILPHPDGSEIHLSAELPVHMLKAFDLFGFDPKQEVEWMEP